MTQVLTSAQRVPQFGGFNGTVSASVSGNALTFAVKTAKGVDPSTSDPVRFTVPNGTGGFTERSITSALSITIPSGATLGAVTGQAFRIWIALFDDAGTPRLAVKVFVQYGTNTYIGTANEGKPDSVATNGSNVLSWYNPTTVITSKYWRFIAYATYETGITAGTYSVAPGVLNLVDASTPRPGTQVQYRIAKGSVSPSISVSSTSASGLSLSIGPSSAASLMEVGFQGYIYGRTGAGSQQANLIISSSVGGAIQQGNWYRMATGDCIDWQTIFAVEAPNTTSVVTYTINIATLTSGLYQFLLNNLYIREIQA
jgi:hypothetical protein